MDPNYGNRDSYERGTWTIITAPSGRQFTQNITSTYRITLIPDRSPDMVQGPLRTRAPFRVTSRALSACGRFWSIDYITPAGQPARAIRLASRSEGHG